MEFDEKIHSNAKKYKEIIVKGEYQDLTALYDILQNLVKAVKGWENAAVLAGLGENSQLAFVDGEQFDVYRDPKSNAEEAFMNNARIVTECYEYTKFMFIKEFDKILDDILNDNLSNQTINEYKEEDREKQLIFYRALPKIHQVLNIGYEIWSKNIDTKLDKDEIKEKLDENLNKIYADISDRLYDGHIMYA